MKKADKYPGSEIAELACKKLKINKQILNMIPADCDPFTQMDLNRAARRILDFKAGFRLGEETLEKRNRNLKKVIRKVIKEINSSEEDGGAGLDDIVRLLKNSLDQTK